MDAGTARCGRARGVASASGKTGGKATGTELAAAAWPGWVPEAARDYIAHVEQGRPIRALAREGQVHPSTVLRRVRRVEASRDDPLVDAAIRQLSGRNVVAMPAPRRAPVPRLAEPRLVEMALPFLRRLAEPGTLLAVACDLANGAILRENPGGEPQRLAVVAREVAEAMACQGWIACADPHARLRRYGLASGGRTLLRRTSHDVSLRMAALSDEGDADDRLRHMRSLLGESPLAGLARRRDGEGRAFLSREQVAWGERLREDVEAVVQGGLAVSWDDLLAEPAPFAQPEGSGGDRPEAALIRAARAVEALGPGLGDVALRCCALLEGIEVVERRCGWSPRSGKVVLRIALDRLGRHYEADDARGSKMIG